MRIGNWGSTSESNFPSRMTTGRLETQFTSPLPEATSVTVESSMRKAIILGLAALFFVASQAPSEAAGRVFRGGRLMSGNRPNIFARVMEFERRKNEFLFGR